jgi:hypothetical protein
MSARVNLLLLLSALLSALSGVGASARAAQVPQAVAAQAPAGRTAQRRAAAVRPAAARLTLSTSAAAPLARALALPAWAPLYASRRRE